MTQRVLWLIRGLGSGGAEHLLVNFARSPAREFDYDVAFTRADKTQLVPELEAAGVGVHQYRGDWPLELARQVRSGEYSVVHSHAPLLASVARVAARAQRHRRPFLAATEHNLWPAYGRATRLANAATFTGDDLHFAVSTAVRESIPLRWRSAVEVVVHGVNRATVRAHLADRAAVRAELGVHDDQILIGTVANYRPHKAWPDFLEAAARVRHAFPAATFVGIGQGPLEQEIRAKHSQLNLGSSVRLMGHQPDAVRLIAGMDIFCLSSIQEGLPVALMEALVLGVPVVATAVGGVPEAVTSGREGLLVPPSDPSLLADALCRLASSQALRSEMSVAAARRGEDFGIDAAVHTIENRYRELLS